MKSLDRIAAGLFLPLDVMENTTIADDRSPVRNDAQHNAPEPGSPANPAVALPSTLGVYAVEELAVNGAFSRIYRGRDRLLGRPVAIKVLALGEACAACLPGDRDNWRRRFVAEARLLAQIDHPHVVRVDALGYLADGTPYMVMPWHAANLRHEIGGDTLEPDLPDAERPRKLAPVRARTVIRQLCLGLAALHARGLVHRDVQPDNLLLTACENGDVRLCGPRFVQGPGPGPAAAPYAGLCGGPGDYRAPEQGEDGAPVTDRADTHAVGVLAYRLLAGTLPVGAVAPVGHAGFDAIIRGAMAPRPSDRPTAVELAAQLHRLQL